VALGCVFWGAGGRWGTGKGEKKERERESPWIAMS
jgi:hypothetical protein